MYRANLHARFCVEGVAVTPSPYPTGHDVERAAWSNYATIMHFLARLLGLGQPADALVLQRLEALRSLEAEAMGLSKDTRMRDLLFARTLPANGV